MCIALVCRPVNTFIPSCLSCNSRTSVSWMVLSYSLRALPMVRHHGIHEILILFTSLRNNMFHKKGPVHKERIVFRSHVFWNQRTSYHSGSFVSIYRKNWELIGVPLLDESSSCLEDQGLDELMEIFLTAANDWYLNERLESTPEI